MTDFSTYFDQMGRAVVSQHQAAMALAQVPMIAVGHGVVQSAQILDDMQLLLAPTAAPKALPAPKTAPKPAVAKTQAAQQQKTTPKVVAKTDRPVAPKPVAKPKLEAVAPTKAKSKAAKKAEPQVAKPAVETKLKAKSKATVVSVTPAGGKAVSLAAIPDPAEKPVKAEKAPTKAPVKAATNTPAKEAAQKAPVKASTKAAPAPSMAKAEPTAKPVANAAAKQSAPAPVAKATGPKPAAPQKPVTKDDLTRIKGIGPKLAQTLNEKGITSFTQIAAWSDRDVETFDATLGAFQGRAKRGNWVAKAKAILEGKEQP
ncbi:helix-hairpin-helix domain-containing protein [Shimia ponticola]|uniref:helix-hairpin-helix domain-containing protein n=1 Tax=Shimia ponticola TaxID=2582893 RepID=UPI0011BE8306|nr:helix-hairpin-helix domain-containing protein [Shimia ponticola]